MAEAGQARRPLACERKWVYLLLMLTAGFYGGYTYTVRGGVFCNAQTGNLVLLAMALGPGGVGGGAVLPASPVRLPGRLHALRGGGHAHQAPGPGPLGHPAGAHRGGGGGGPGLPAGDRPPPDRPGDHQFPLLHAVQHLPPGPGHPHGHHLLHQPRAAGGRRPGPRPPPPEEPRWRRKVLSHLEMLAVFVAGCAAATALSGVFLGRTIWWTLVPLGIVGGWLLYADLKGERGRLEQVPKGH